MTLPRIGNVASFWGSRLDGPVREAAGTGLVVDLRSSTYAGFWRPPTDLARRVATVRVLHEKDGSRSVVSHANKASKGRLVRSMLEDRQTPTTPSGLADRLRAGGWKVEEGPAGHHGTRLDVVVPDVAAARPAPPTPQPRKADSVGLPLNSRSDDRPSA